MCGEIYAPGVSRPADDNPTSDTAIFLASAQSFLPVGTTNIGGHNHQETIWGRESSRTRSCRPDFLHRLWKLRRVLWAWSRSLLSHLPPNIKHCAVCQQALRYLRILDQRSKEPNARRTRCEQHGLVQGRMNIDAMSNIECQTYRFYIRTGNGRKLHRSFLLALFKPAIRTLPRRSAAKRRKCCWSASSSSEFILRDPQLLHADNASQEKDRRTHRQVTKIAISLIWVSEHWSKRANNWYLQPSVYEAQKGKIKRAGCCNTG